MNNREIVVKLAGRDLLAAPGEPLGDLLQRAGVTLSRDCGGRGHCGKCLVKVVPPEAVYPPDENERAVLGSEQLAFGLRLACQAKVLDSLAVEPLREEEGAGQAESYKSGLMGRFAVDHSVRRVVLAGDRLGRIDSDQGGSSLTSQLAARLGESELKFGPRVLAPLSELAYGKGEITLALENGRVLTVLPGASTHCLGVAVDIGTTTLGVYLCDLDSGRIIAADSSANPQRRYGDDVISRISAASENPPLSSAMQQLVVSAVNKLIRSACSRAGCRPEDVDQACIVGNPTMQTLFLGWKPTSLGMAPYFPVTNEPQNLPAEATGLCLHPGARVRLFPLAGGFIGGDAIAAALCIEDSQGEHPTLALDLGTNGELLILKDGQAWAASAATGPAFEGANIQKGMRATPGAVERVWWDGDRRTFGYSLVPDHGRYRGLALGLCGSGLIDAMAVLLEQEIIGPTGRIVADRPGVAVDHQGRAWAVELLPAEACHDSAPLYLTQADIRQVQLAKAALRVGLEYLFRESGCERVARTVITGAFGVGFHWPSAARIGLFPAGHRLGQIETIRNAAGRGAVMALLDNRKRQRAEQLGRCMKVVELNQQKDFNDRFIEALNFPSSPEEA